MHRSMLIAALALLPINGGFLWAAEPRNYAAEHNRELDRYPKSQFAMPHYYKAIAAMTAWEGKADDAPKGKISKPGENAWPQVVEWLEKNQEAIGHMRTAASKPYVGNRWSDGVDEVTAKGLGIEAAAGTANPMLHSVLLPHLVKARGFVRVLAQDSYRAAEANEPETVVSNLRAIWMLGEQVGREPAVIEQLVGIASYEVAINTLSEIMTRHPDFFKETHLAELNKVFSRSTWRKDFRMDLAGEKNFFDDFINRCFDEGDTGRITQAGIETIANTSESSQREIGSIKVSHVAPRKEQLTVFHAFISDMTKEFALPLYAYHPEVLDKHEKLVIFRDFADRYKYFPAKVLMPAVEKTYLSSEHVWLRRTGAVVGIALERYRLKNGGYPETLKKLVPKYLDEVPRDRFVDRPLMYTLVDGRPRVYSAGADQDDDGGTPLKENRPWPEGEWLGKPASEQPSYDFVVWPVE